MSLTIKQISSKIQNAKSFIDLLESKNLGNLNANLYSSVWFNEDEFIKLTLSKSEFEKVKTTLNIDTKFDKDSEYFRMLGVIVNTDIEKELT